MKKIITLAAGLALLTGTVCATETELPMIEALDSPVLEHFMAEATAAIDNRQALYNAFLLNESKMFNTSDLEIIISQLKEMNAGQLITVSNAGYLDPTVNLAISILVGGLGVDRFLIGDIGAGVGKLLTAGGLGIWWLVDIFRIQNLTKEHNYDVYNETVLIANNLM